MFGGYLNLVFCIDENYVKYAKVSISSYRKHNPKAKIYVVSEYPIENTVGYDKNIIIKLPKKFRNRGEGDRITNTAYLKLFLTELPFDKVLYVDADTMCQKPLDSLWEIEPEYIAVTESHAYGEIQAMALGLKRYALSGMMLMNLKNLREFKLTEKFLEWHDTNKIPSNVYQHDESAINCLFKDKLTFIPVAYNYCHNRTYKKPIKEQDAYILHYVGKDKADMLHETTYENIKVISPYIRGKRVAIVGNAKSIFDKRNGKEIDEHDTVIRFNKGFIYNKDAQGSFTTMVFLACNLASYELQGYNAQFFINRSNHYYNPTNLRVSNGDRKILADRLGAQPSTGFMVIDICLKFGAKQIDLYGFDWEKTPTFYNEPNYVTQHKYSEEEKIVLAYKKQGLLTIN